MVDIFLIVPHCRFIVERRLTGLVIYGVRTVFCNTLLKEREGVERKRKEIEAGTG